MGWLSQNSSAINAITGICTLFVWLFYAQLLYLNFKRQRQPKIVINRGAGRSLETQCLVSNMSSEPIFIEHLIAVLHTDRGTLMRDLIDLEKVEGKDRGATNLAEITRQGPMLSGNFNQVGTFEEIVGRVLRYHEVTNGGSKPMDGRTVHTVELRVIAIYGSEDAPVGTVRSFQIGSNEQGARTVLPTSLRTQRYASRWRRRKVKRWIRELNN